jgi:hypothetical protein
MKKAKKHSLDHKRRKFLRDSATLTAGAAAAVSLPGLASTENQQAVADESKRQKGYRLTPHIAAYYKTMIS